MVVEARKKKKTVAQKFFLLSLSRKDRPAVSSKGDRAFKSVGSKKAFHSPEFFVSSLWCEPRCRRVPLFT